MNSNFSMTCVKFLRRQASVSFVVAVFACWALFLVGDADAAKKRRPTTVTAIEVVTKGDATRFFAELTSDTRFTATVLAEPYRVIIDMADVAFDLPSGAGQQSKGLIRQVRYGIIEKGKSRIVIDTEGPVLIKESLLVPKKGKAMPRISLELSATTPEAFAAGQERDEAALPQASSPEVTASLPVMMPKIPLGDGVKKAGRRLVVIDPGHGGIDPGAISRSKTKEKDVVFAFAQEVRDALKAEGKHEVALTRETDRFMTLNDRVAFTKRAQADLFIAIHADILRGQTATGTTLYTLSDTASDEEAEALALKENKTDIIAGVNLGEQVVEVADVLIELVQRESKNHANLFSRKALDELKGVTTMTGKPLRSAGFVVLKVPDVPSVLIELGFLSNKEDERKLNDPVWRKRMAVALARAIDKHFADMDAVE
jgi:N-acetylmuramoyl-L-alanine amidase